MRRSDRCTKDASAPPPVRHRVGPVAGGGRHRPWQLRPQELVQESSVSARARRGLRRRVRRIAHVRPTKAVTISQKRRWKTKRKFSQPNANAEPTRRRDRLRDVLLRQWQADARRGRAPRELR